MFTGLVEEVGHVSAIAKRPNAVRLSIRARHILDGVAVGDSVAVNGVCVTITRHSDAVFTADVMPETIKATTLKELRRGDPVNLERAMQTGGRYGGHFMTGHVDGVGRIVRTESKGNARYVVIRPAAELVPEPAVKGSVAIDGTSLTVFAAESGLLTVSLIPHTSAHSVLGRKKTGDTVNIECDVLQKYMRNERRVKSGQRPNHSELSYETLLKNGFIQ